MTTQPEALRLADALEDDLHADDGTTLGRYSQGIADNAAAELRRQHERIKELEAALPTIKEIEDAKDNWERFENATKELQSAHESAYSSGMVEGERMCIKRIAELEAALDAALEALEKHGTSYLNHEDEYAEAVAKLKGMK